MSENGFLQSCFREIKCKHKSHLHKKSGFDDSNGLIILKPELANSLINTEAVFSYFHLLCDKYSVCIDSCHILPGRYLKEHNLINGVYEKAYVYASMSPNVFAANQELYTRIVALSGSECEVYGSLSLQSLGYSSQHIMALWRCGEPAVRIEEGLYVVEADLDGRRIVLANGFYPLQLSHFISDKSRSIFFTFHSDSPFEILKFFLQGSTNPEESHPDSLRGFLYRNKDKFGIDINISRNAIHLSGCEQEGIREVDLMRELKVWSTVEVRES
ncbi:nucleoside-diphosphate kinase [Hahella sp. HN01]|uniref:nucleoside-diphosphate kinase n=1 Tax=Hahella sp. HN01 TaxID=2847262 RepID=UPI001C1EA283|nr:nucleoside-diphosphate kinase [Hahella sp. HN01]MBU6954624.1 nucleoside-diphosphate kinase [Hahella sp. HN01]